jgi:hypothetical protein
MLRRVVADMMVAMKAVRHARFCRCILIGICLVVATVAGLSDLSAAGPSADEFRKRYDLPQDPKTALEDILARDEFRNQEESWISQVQRLMWETILRALKWIFDRLPGFNFDIDDDIGQMILDTQLVGMIALVAGLAAWMVVRLIRSRRHRIRVINSPEDHAPADSPGSAGARAMALKLAEQGDYRGALIHLFRYVLTLLDEKGRLTVGPGKTNREVLNSIPNGEPLKAPLAEMIPLFNRVRYGDAGCGKVDFERFQDLSRIVTERI